MTTHLRVDAWHDEITGESDAWVFCDMELKGIKMETAKAVPVAERLRAIKIGRYTVDEGSHSKHFAVAAVCQEAAQEIERLQEKVDYLLDGMRDIFPAAHRLALELECLLLGTEDTAAVSKWWDSAHEALEQWREFCREDAERPNASLSGLPRTED